MNDGVVHTAVFQTEAVARAFVADRSNWWELIIWIDDKIWDDDTDAEVQRTEAPWRVHWIWTGLPHVRF